MTPMWVEFDLFSYCCFVNIPDIESLSERHRKKYVYANMIDRKQKGLTEARRRANKKYNDRFVEIKVRVTPEKRAIIKDHAEKMGESATAFINRAIDEAMKRDQIN